METKPAPSGWCKLTLNHIWSVSRDGDVRSCLFLVFYWLADSCLLVVLVVKHLDFIYILAKSLFHFPSFFFSLFIYHIIYQLIIS